jgi:CoA:oxalate CoA-transferase
LEKPLDGIRIISATGALFGPYCAMLLGNMGAEVIKIEKPGSGDMNREWGPFFPGVEGPNKSAYFAGIHRGQKSVAINLKNPKAKEILMELIKKSDVFIQNFKPGTLEEWGLGYEDLKKANPKIIYAAGSGFGQYGPYSSWPSYDIIGQAMGGFMDMNGWPDKPPCRAGSSIGDIVSGMFLAIGILAALRYRDRTGKGQMIDVAQVDSMVAVSETATLKYTIENVVPTRSGAAHPSIAPFDIYPTPDGWVCIAAGNDGIFKRFSEAMGKPELATDQRFDTNPHRNDNYKELKPIIAEWTKDKKKWDITNLLHKSEIPCGPVYNIKEVVEDEHVSKYREMIVEVDQPPFGKCKMTGFPIKFSETKILPNEPAPMLGEHTEQVLGSLLGYSKSDMEQLKKEGVF